MEQSITIRRSTEHDEAALLRLAGLDSARVPEGDKLLGFVGGDLWAAVAVDSGSAVADPFAPTVDLVELLRARAGQEHGHEHRSRLGFAARPLRKVRLA